LLAKVPEAERRIEAARERLAAAEAAVTAIAAREETAINDPATYDKWQREHFAAAAEVTRIGKLVASFEEQATRESKEKGAAAFRERVDAQNRANQLLARRLCDEGAKAAAVLRDLMHDVARAATADAAINASLGPADQIPSAELIARGQPFRARENVSEKRLEMWVFSSTGVACPNQSDVRVEADGTGSLPSGAQGSFRIRCVKRKFRKIQYREEKQPTRIEPRVMAARIPRFDGPGLLWDGPRISHPSRALEIFDQLSQVSTTMEDDILTELVPVGDWPPEEGQA
jgi:hypothetical protein